MKALPKCTYRTLCIIAILSLMILAMSTYNLQQNYYNSAGMYIIDWKLTTTDISCHRQTKDDALPQLPTDFSPPDKSIFIHETSCRGGLNSRQACAVESAARAHPNWDVHVFFSGPVSKIVLEKSCLSILRTYTNVKLRRIHHKAYANRTIVQNFFDSNPIEKSSYRVSHTSDVLRYLTLYKFGGVYMDSDVVVVKSFDSLASDWSARESSYAIDAGLMSFSKSALGRSVARAAILDFKRNYNPKKWGNNGPGVITRVVSKMCSKKTNKNWIKGCKGFVVYEPEVFYPVYYPDNKQYFQAGRTMVTSNRTYAHHLWNALTHGYKVPPDSPYADLARQYCPRVYGMFGNDFGV